MFRSVSPAELKSKLGEYARRPFERTFKALARVAFGSEIVNFVNNEYATHDVIVGNEREAEQRAAGVIRVQDYFKDPKPDGESLISFEPLPTQSGRHAQAEQWDAPEPFMSQTTNEAPPAVLTADFIKGHHRAEL